MFSNAKVSIFRSVFRRHLFSYWRGFNFSNINPEFVTDYDRACEIDDYIGIIDIDSGYGLVLGDDPCQTTWFQFPEIQNGLLVRWIFAENAESNNINLPFEKCIFTPVFCQSVSCKLLNASITEDSCEGTNVDEKLRIEMSKGWYEVETLLYEPNKQTSLILHRFSNSFA